MKGIGDKWASDRNNLSFYRTFIISYMFSIVYFCFMASNITWSEYLFFQQRNNFDFHITLEVSNPMAIVYVSNGSSMFRPKAETSITSVLKRHKIKYSKPFRRWILLSVDISNGGCLSRTTGCLLLPFVKSRLTFSYLKLKKNNNKKIINNDDVRFVDVRKELERLTVAMVTTS